MTTDYQKVLRGGAFLDEHYTDGNWREKIDWDRLDIAHPTHCMLGQLYGSYYGALSKLNIGYEEAERMGFDSPVAGLHRPMYTHDLTAEWKKVYAPVDDLATLTEGLLA